MKCERCEGTGAVRLSGDFSDGTPGYTWCVDCDGTGEVDDDETKGVDK